MTKVKVRSPKWYGWRPDLPDKRDEELKLADIPRVGATLPSKHQLPAKWMPPIRDQGDQGSCTGHMAYGIATYLHLWSGQQPEKFSPRFAYWNARFFESATKEDGGAQIRDAIKGLVKFGIATEHSCPYSPRRYSVKPGSTAFKIALAEMVTGYRRIKDTDISTVKAALAADLPVGFGFSCYENMDSDEVAMDTRGLLPMPGGKLDGGHAVWACGYDDEKVDYDEEHFKNAKIGWKTPGALLIANSWGKNWGIQPEGYPTRGYFWMPYAYVMDRDLADDLWCCHKIT